MQPKYGFYRPVRQALLILLAAVALLGLLAALFTVRWIFIAALVGIGLGTLIIPVAEWGRRKYHVPRTVTAALALLCFYGVFFFVGYALVNMISEQIVPVLQNIPHVLQSLQAKFSEFSRLHPTLGRAGQNFDLQKYFGGAADAVVSGLKMGANVIGGLVFIYFIALYLAIRSDGYLEGFVSAFPKHLRPKTREVTQASARALRHWFWAQLTAMFIVAVIAAIALKVVGSQYWLFFGAIAFVLELVPYFGPLSALAIVCIVTLASDPGAFLKTAIAFAIVLFLEGNVIIPVIMKGRIKLPPVHLLILMTVLGTWFGIFGFLMAAPTLAVLRTIYLRAYLPRVDRLGVPPSEIPPSQKARPAA